MCIRDSNNLAYVYRQWMDPALQGEALRLAQKSYAMRQQLNDRRGLAYSHQTLGEIYRDYNDLIRARGHLEKARRLFTEFAPEHEREVAMVDLALANIARKEHDPALVDSLLQQLIPVLQRLSDDEGLSQAYNEYGCELRKRGHEESRTARQYEAAAGGRQTSPSRYYNLTWTQTLNSTTVFTAKANGCLLYTSPSPRDRTRSRMPSSA